MAQLPRQRAFILIFCALFSFAILAGCGANIAFTRKYVIISANISPNADKIVMAVRSRSGGASHLIVYDFNIDKFSALPAVEGGWQPSEPVFSNDQSMIAVGAICVSECLDKSDRMRHLIFMIKENTWKIAASGDGFRRPPRFLPGDKKLIYVGGPMRPGKRLSACYPEPTALDLASRKETYLSTCGAEFYLLLTTQLEPDSSVWFVGIAPKKRDLEKQVKALDKQAGHVVSIPYQLPVKNIDGAVVPNGSLKIIDSLSAFTGRDDIAHLTVASNRNRFLFVDSKSIGRGRLEERIHVLETRNIRTLLSTIINIERLSVFSDGRKVLILGDPKRRGRAGLQDFFILDVDDGEINPFPLLRRLYDFLNKRSKR